VLVGGCRGCAGYVVEEVSQLSQTNLKEGL
jgi:hypothetical protein